MKTAVDLLVAESLLGSDAYMRRAGRVLSNGELKTHGGLVRWNARGFQAVTGIIVLHRRW